MTQSSYSPAQSLSADVLAIMNLRSSYGDIIDRLVRNGPNAEDEALLEAVFTPDCVLDFEALLGVHSGWPAIRKLFVEWHPENISWMWHSFHSPIITVDGDTATGKWSLIAMGTTKGENPVPPPMTYGRYTDQYVRYGSGWRINHQHFLDETRR